MNHDYTVVGIYEETGERFAGFYYAPDAPTAEKMAGEEHPELTICAVFHGELTPII